ncbi:hypothetical protein T439DRAFT_156386 [Meredithblackwellia eburnea MCA 4105]
MQRVVPDYKKNYDSLFETGYPRTTSYSGIREDRPGRLQEEGGSEKKNGSHYSGGLPVANGYTGLDEKVQAMHRDRNHLRLKSPKELLVGSALADPPRFFERFHRESLNALGDFQRAHTEWRAGEDEQRQRGEYLEFVVSSLWNPEMRQMLRKTFTEVAEMKKEPRLKKWRSTATKLEKCREFLEDNFREKDYWENALLEDNQKPAPEYAFEITPKVLEEMYTLCVKKHFRIPSEEELYRFDPLHQHKLALDYAEAHRGQTNPINAPNFNVLPGPPSINPEFYALDQVPDHHSHRDTFDARNALIPSGQMGAYSFGSLSDDSEKPSKKSSYHSSSGGLPRSQVDIPYFQESSVGSTGSGGSFSNVYLGSELDAFHGPSESSRSGSRGPSSRTHSSRSSQKSGSRNHKPKNRDYY